MTMTDHQPTRDLDQPLPIKVGNHWWTGLAYRYTQPINHIRIQLHELTDPNIIEQIEPIIGEPAS